MRYTKGWDGQWYEIANRKKFYIQCCGCGLSHRFKFRVRKGKIQFQAFRLRKR